MNHLFPNLNQLDEGNWWVEIITMEPWSMYYFGPFNDFQDANVMQPGYVADLIEEGVQTIQVTVKECHPVNLTLFEE
jgi:hypothetical protein